MKFQIRKGINSLDGNDIFRVYKEDGLDWVYQHSTATQALAEKYIAREIAGKEEIVVAEIEG